MRKRFEQNPELDFLPISEVVINTKTRHQLAPMLVALQYIFTNQDLSEQVFRLIEDKVTSHKKNTGRLGMTLWEILVFGVVRLNLNIDYDFLLDHANNHAELRGILGVRNKGVFGKNTVYKYQTIIDNVCLIDDETISAINELLVKAGHDMIKKKEKKEVLALSLKSDSYAVESTVHFPTDISLSWDSARKIFDTVSHIERIVPNLIIGFRERKSFERKIKNLNRKVSEIHRKKGCNYKQRLNKSTESLLASYEKLISKVQDNISVCALSTEIRVVVLAEDLVKYRDYLKLFIDQLRRRILEDETIPHGEKVFSIFEPEVEWLQKGKQNNKVELGHNVLVTTDQYNFILDSKVMINQRDNSQPIELLNRLEKSYQSNYEFKSISFDRGFYSKLSKEAMEKKFTTVVMPNKGRTSAKNQEEVKQKEFKHYSNKHSAVESNINELEHSGVDKVPDKGVRGFKRYVGYGVIAYNLKRLGKLILQYQEEASKATKRKSPGRLAA